MATAQSKTQLLLDGGQVTKNGGGDLSRAPLLHFQAFFSILSCIDKSLLVVRKLNLNVLKAKIVINWLLCDQRVQK